MRIALLSDIHGNLIALDAVLADIERQGGTDAYWVLGDLVALGPDPVGVLKRLAKLPNARFVRGNADRYITSGERPPPTLADACADPELLPILVEVTASFAWTCGAVGPAGWLPWLRDLPTEQRMTLPSGVRLLGIHATPGADDSDGIHPALSDAELEALLAGCEAEIVCAGHTHWPLDREVAGLRVVNLGSVSNPVSTDLRACYVLLEADSSGYWLQHHRADYDRDLVIAQLEQLDHPGAGYIVQFMRGQYQSRWLQAEHR